MQNILWVKACCVQKLALCKNNAVDKGLQVSVKKLLCAQASLCKSLLSVNASLCQIFSVESIGVACFGAEIRFWSRFSARGELR